MTTPKITPALRRAFADRLASDGDFIESDHPRDDAGKFSSGGGGGNAAATPATPAAKPAAAKPGTKLVYNHTPERVEKLRKELELSGVKGARLKKLPNGAVRLVLKSPEDREAARDAIVMADACTSYGASFTDPKTAKFSWNGPTEVFLRFLK